MRVVHIKSGANKNRANWTLVQLETSQGFKWHQIQLKRQSGDHYNKMYQGNKRLLCVEVDAYAENSV